VNSLLRKLVKRSKSVYIHHWDTNVHSVDTHNKLRVYAQFKHSFSAENYLLYMSKSETKKYFTRLRISAHDLKIEHDCYKYPKIPVENRLCLHCNVLENECHFVISCTAFNKYTSIRECLFTSIVDIHPEFINMSLAEKFIFIMSASDADTCNLVERFIIKMVKTRGHL